MQIEILQLPQKRKIHFLNKERNNQEKESFNQNLKSKHTLTRYSTK